MAIDEKVKFCRRCRRETLHARNRGEELGCAMTLLSCGLLFPVWVLMELLRGYRCQHCGRRG